MTNIKDINKNKRNIKDIKSNLGLLVYDLAGFMTREDADLNFVNFAFVAGGQGAGYITAEFARLGYYTLFYNTCEQDILKLKQLLKEENIPENNYEILHLKGYDGAAKTRNIGLQAIKDNAEAVQKAIADNERLQKADFVWYVVALGGGTGNGSTGLVTQILSAVRANKRIGVEKDFEGNIINYGNPSVGVIAAFPEKNEGYDIQLNAAEALLELKELQKNGVIGSVLILDNQKLKDDWRDSKLPEKGIKWSALGNMKTAQILTEISTLVSLPGEETFDKSEWLQVLSTPGFLTVGKKELNKNWIDDVKTVMNKDGLNNEVKDREAIKYLVKDILEGSQVFASGYDYDRAIHGALAVVRPEIAKKEEPVITLTQTEDFKDAISDLLYNVPKVHKGVFINSTWGNISKVKQDKDEAIIYTVAVLDELPERVLRAMEDALERKRKSITSQKVGVSLEDMKEKLNVAGETQNKPTTPNIQDIFKSGGVLNSNAEKNNSISDILKTGGILNQKSNTVTIGDNLEDSNKYHQFASLLNKKN